MEFTPANRNDIQKYYQNTYVKFKERAFANGDSIHPETLFHISGVDGQKVVGKCENGDEFVIWLSDEHPFEVDYVLPHKSFFQHGDKAVLLERIPAQQYFRGLNGENTQMTYLQDKMPKKVPLTFESLKEFVTKQSFFTLSSAINADTMVSCVLSPRMQFVRINNMICVDHLPVAKVNGNKIIILKPIFQEEVENLLKVTNEKQLFDVMISRDMSTVKKVAVEVTL